MIELLLFLWRECDVLWDESLAYRTLRAVETATADFIEGLPVKGLSEKDSRESYILHIVGQAMSLHTADADVFKQMNLSSAEGLKQAAESSDRTVHAVKETASCLGVLDSLPKDIYKAVHHSYKPLIDAAEALKGFEDWLETCHRLGSEQPCQPVTSGDSHALLCELNSIDVVKPSPEELSDLARSRREPWERLLIEIRKIVSSSEMPETARDVFVPKRVLIRYCYPFAVEVEGNEQTLNDQLKTEKDSLDNALKVISKHVKVRGELKPLAPTEFFTQDRELYDGVRVYLPDIEVEDEQPPAVSSSRQGKRCTVWINLSNMGNHCLCIEPKPRDAPLPHELYRALRAGTPSVVGATVKLSSGKEGKGSPPERESSFKKEEEEEVTWDNLYSFSRDVIHAIAIAYANFWPGKKGGKEARSQGRRPGPQHRIFRWHREQNSRPQKPGECFQHGNLHEIVVVQTDSPLRIRPEKIAGVLDRAIGGRILARPVQRTAATLEEWVRYPSVRRPGNQGTVSMITDMPEMGLAGDWCLHTGETTVFGIVATPSWLRDIYVEAAQFANSWSPRLRLWNRQLETAIDSVKFDTGKKRTADNEKACEKLGISTDRFACIYPDKLRKNLPVPSQTGGFLIS